MGYGSKFKEQQFGISGAYQVQGFEQKLRVIALLHSDKNWPIWQKYPTPKIEYFAIPET